VKLRAVGFDPGEIDTRLVGMDDSEIDPKVGDANLRMNDPVPGFQRAFDRFFERRFRVAAGWGESLGDGAGPVLGEFEEVLEVDDPARVRSAEIDLLGVHAREDDHLAARADDRDVEAAVPALRIERRDLRCDATGYVGSDGAGENNHFAFVALHVL
jgi:hypothetical protein